MNNNVKQTMNTHNILLVDDEVEIVNLIEVYLKNEGYGVIKAHDGGQALEELELQPVQLVVLDVMMPGMDGLEICRRIREVKNIPVIMLSAKNQDMDKILALGIGADDYMTKPFNPMELVARIKSQLRRYFFLGAAVEVEQIASSLKVKEGITIERDSHRVMRFGEELSLTPTEYEILLLLAENPGRVFSAEQIFQQVWKEKYFDSNNTVMVHMWRLREKVEINPKEPKIIETVWGVGYKIEK